MLLNYISSLLIVVLSTGSFDTESTSNQTEITTITQKTTNYKTNVTACYYSNKFNGRKTASGKRFNNNQYTAAHKKLPFGTKVKVTNTANNKVVVVTITDRGPFSKGKEIDLTQRAFKEIAHKKGVGILKVNLEIID